MNFFSTRHGLGTVGVVYILNQYDIYDSTRFASHDMTYYIKTILKQLNFLSMRHSYDSRSTMVRINTYPGNLRVWVHEGTPFLFCTGTAVAVYSLKQFTNLWFSKLHNTWHKKTYIRDTKDHERYSSGMMS